MMILVNIFLNIFLIVLFNSNKKYERSEKNIEIYDIMIVQTWFIISMQSVKLIFLGHLNTYVDLVLALASNVLSFVVLINALRISLHRRNMRR